MATVGALYLFATADHRVQSAGFLALTAPEERLVPGYADDAGSESPGESAEPAPEPLLIRTTIDQSCGVDDLLESLGLGRADARRWASAFVSAARTRMLRHGHQVALYKDPETDELRGLGYDLDERVAVETRGLGNGVVIATRRPIEYLVREVARAFVVRDSFDRTVVRNEIPRTIAERLEEAFGNRRPMGSLRRGTAFRLIYEEHISRDGAHKLIGELQAAQLQIGSRTFNAYAFRDEHGRAYLYDERGNPLGPRFLRFPLPFEYISSGFSSSRYHPILHRYRPHVGVDLVARYGTPVRAVSDGRVESAGWAGELGRCVRLTHDNDLVSIYGHLSNISKSIGPGAYVRIGQIVGWVGTSGLSTGPHLHFALFKRGRYVNPLTVRLEGSHEIAPRMRALFGKLKRQYQAALSKLPDLASHSIAAVDRKPAISKLADRYHVEVKPLAKSSAKARWRALWRSRQPAGQPLWATAGDAGDLSSLAD